MMQRRQMFRAGAVSLATVFCPQPQPAHAVLLQFPIGPNTQPLKNRYHFMRAGPSELEIEGIYSTNPLFLTNRENAMHKSGEAIVLESVKLINKDPPTVVYHSLAANGMDTGDLIARKTRLARDRLLPEFTYLDQRSLGLWDSNDQDFVRPAVWAMDYNEAGPEGFGGRPPANDDGTPNETLHDQFLRLRQFISLQESRTSGETILIIFPDGTGPALLSCMIAGIPVKEVHALEYQPGEIRLDISPEAVRTLYEERKEDPKYLAILQDGKEKLKELRGQQTFVSLKDRREEKERADMEIALQRKKQADAQREAQRRLDEETNKRLQMEQKAQQRREREEAKAAKALQQQKERDDAKAAAAAKALSSSSSSSSTSQPSEDGIDFSSPLVVGAGLGVAGLGLASLLAVGMNEANGNSGNTKETTAAPKETKDLAEDENDDLDVTSSVPALFAEEVPILVNTTPLLNKSPPMKKKKVGTDHVSNGRKEEEDENDRIEITLTEDSIDEALNKLATAEQAMKDALEEVAANKEQASARNDGSEQRIATATGQSKESEQGPISEVYDSVDDDMEDYDDGANDWLRALVEIRDEDDEEEVVIINGESSRGGDDPDWDAF